MQRLQIDAICKIHAGKIDEFQAAARKLLAAVREKDTGTLQYDWFLDRERGVCVVREAYADSSALLQHMANMGSLLGGLMELTDLSVEIFGDPSPELAAALAGAKPTIYRYLQGL